MLLDPLRRTALRPYGRATVRLPAAGEQAIRSLEQQIGAPLFERTSRRVRLTPLGRQLHGSLAPAYQDLCGAMRDAAAAARGVDGTLRVGFLGSAANEYTTEIIDAFRDCYPACALTMTEVHFADPLGRLRAEEVDVLITRLPAEEADLTVGPTVVLEPRVLAVAAAHVLAGRDSVSLEDVADHPVFAVAGRAPAYWWDFHVPPMTRAGRPLHRLMSVSTVQELLALVAAGQGVAPMVASVPRYYGRPDLAFVPIRDMPPSAVALVWR